MIPTDTRRIIVGILKWYPRRAESERGFAMYRFDDEPACTLDERIPVARKCPREKLQRRFSLDSRSPPTDNRPLMDNPPGGGRT